MLCSDNLLMLLKSRAERREVSAEEAASVFVDGHLLSYMERLLCASQVQDRCLQLTLRRALGFRVEKHRFDDVGGTPF